MVAGEDSGVRVTVFNTKSYERETLDAALKPGLQLIYLEPRLLPQTAALAGGSRAVCAFANDDVGAATLEVLADVGVRLVALRSAGFNHVDLDTADRLGIAVARVPAYSPHAIAEYTMGLVLSLNRKIHRAHNRVREGNFALEGLLGFDMHGKTFGIIGTGRIGAILARIAAGFGCILLGNDVVPDAECEALGMRYVSREEILGRSDILSLNCPLTPDTLHLIRHETLPLLKRGMMLVNTGRGALVDAAAVIDGLKDGIIGSLALDVYEEEADIFFKDLSGTVLQDDVFARLLTFPNALITAHQGFFTDTAIANIAETTIANLMAFAETGRPLFPVETDKVVRRG